MRFTMKLINLLMKLVKPASRNRSGADIIEILSTEGFDDISIIETLKDQRLLESYGFNNSDRAGIDQAYRSMKKKWPTIKKE